ncbi:MAG: DNA polymerase III subunit gamma/tau [Burkholderiales bacterium]
MSYQVLARKWRPRDFATLLGQEHVVRALRNALTQQRLHHAYLLTGTRGVGKTTLARILAKCLNCETGITDTPCGRCTACTEIDGGRFIDYVEMDAASNRGVDEMTQLLERAVYGPTSGRFKVYVIDEVHQLSGHAFNAMLKTLEEPPAHLKFVLATTDPQKVPVTVLSRCLQFNLKQMPREVIVQHLQKVLEAESVAFQPEALSLLAQAASGSMRDALSLLDQAIAYGAGRIESAEVRAMLGVIEGTVALRVLEAVAQADARSALGIADELQERTLSFENALQDVASLLLRIAIAQTVPESVEPDLPERDRVVALATRIDPESVQLYYQIATQGREDIHSAPDEHAGFTMTLLRMLAFRPEGSTVEPASASAPRAAAKPAASAPAAGQAFDGNWAKLCGQLEVSGVAKELARHSELVRFEDECFDLVVPKAMPHLAEPAYREKLRAALQQRLGRPVRVRVASGEVRGVSAAALTANQREAKQAEAVQAVHGDRFVNELVTLLDGRVVEQSVQSARKGD